MHQKVSVGSVGYGTAVTQMSKSFLAELFYSLDILHIQKSEIYN